MQRFVHRALAGVAIATAFAIAPAATAATISSPTSYVEPGETFQVPISISDSAGVDGIDSGLFFDSSQLTFVSATGTSTATQSTTCGEESPGFISLSTTATTPGTSVGDGLLCTLTFTMPATAIPDETSIFFNDESGCNVYLDVGCSFFYGPVFAVGDPEFGSSPPPGTPLAISTVPGEPGTTNVNVFANTTAPVTVTAQPMTAPFSVAPLGPQTVGQTPALAAQGKGLFGLTYTVTCQSDDAGVFTQNLVLATDDPAQPTVTYPVTCTVNGAEVVASPTPGTPLQVATATSTNGFAPFTLQNIGVGTELAVIPNTLPAPFFFADAAGNPIVASQVPQGQTFTYNIGCNSTTPGLYTGNLSIQTNDFNENPVVYPVECAVGGPDIDLSPVAGSTLSLSAATGQPASTTFTIFNQGFQPLNYTLSGLSGALSAAPASGTVAANSGNLAGSQTVTVSCSAAPNTPLTQTLTIASDDPDEPSLTYTVQCAAQVGGYSSSPSPGSQITINTSAGTTGQGTLTITSIGTADLVIDASGLTAPFAIVAPTNRTIQPDRSTLLEITCNSPDAGTFDQTLTVTTNDPNLPTATYPVRCVASGPEASATPPSNTQLNIATALNQSGSATFTFANTGDAPLTFVTGTPAPPFGVSPQSGSIAPGATQLVTLTCLSSAAGTYNTTFNFTTNDANEPSFVYPVQCVVGGAEIDTTPAAGSTIALAGPAFSTINGNLLIANLGQAPLNVTLSGLSAPLSATPTTTSIAAGQNANVGITCSPAPTATVTQTLTVASNDLDEPSLTYTVTCTGTVSGTRGIEIVAGDGQTGATGTELDIPPTVRLIDPFAQSGFGENVPVQFSIVEGDAIFVASGTTDVVLNSGPDGVVGAQVLLGDTAGPIVIVAGAAGYGSVQFQVTSTGTQQPGARTLTIVGGNNQTAVPNGDGAPLSVLLAQNGTPVANQSIAWSVVSGTGLVLGANTSTTNAEGVASVALSFGSSPTAGVIEARDSTGLTVRFTVLPAAGTAVLRIVSGDGQTGGRQTLADEPIVFELASATGTPLAGAELAFTIIEGSATLSAPTATTDASGRASVRLRYGNTVGPVRVQVTALSGSVRGTAIATVFDVLLSKVAGDQQTGPVSTKLPVPLTIAISRPAAAKGLAGAPVTWTVLTGGGTLSNVQAVTDANGRASAELTLGSTPGPNQVRATVAGIGEVTFEETAAVAGTIQIIAGNNQTLATNEASGPLSVRLVNSAGQPIPNARIVWSSSDEIELSATETRTDANGNATVTARLLQPGGGTVTATAADAPNAPSVSFSVNGGIVETEGATDSEQEVASALDQACPILAARAEAGQPLTAGEVDLLARCVELIEGAGEIPGETRTALEELIADEASAQNNAALIVQASQFDNLKARIAALRSGTQGASFSGLALQNSTGSLPLSFLPSMILAEADEGGASDEIGADFSRWGFFATGTIGQGDRDAGERDPGFAFDTYGLTAGVDYRFSDKLVFGGALGYNQNDTDLDGDDGGLDATGYSLSGYATWYQGNSFYVDSVLTVGRNDYDVERRIQYQITNPAGGTTSIDQVASASPGSDTTSFAVSIGRDWNRGALSIGPYVRGLYTTVDFDGYEEELSNPNAPGAGLGVRVDAREIKSMQAVIGGKISYTKSMAWGILIPNAQVEYLHEFEDDPASVTTRFLNDPTGTPIELELDTVDKGYFNLGFGLSAVFAQGRSAFVYFEHRAGQDRVSYDNLAVGVRIEF